MAMESHKALKNLGLTNKEADVYMGLLQLGRGSAHSIARKSGQKRPTVYVILDELIEKGFVEQVPRTKKQVYTAKSPDEVFAVAHERLNTAESVLPELRALAKEGSDTKVKTTYYEGLKQVQDAHFDTLRAENTEFVGWLSNTPFEVRGKDFWYDQYRTKRLEKNISNRVIVPDEPWLREYARQAAKTPLQQTRVDTDTQFQIDADIYMYDEDRVVITSFQEEMGLIIESAKVHNALKAIFERHWRTLGEASSDAKSG